jgi:hypothetical protein
VGRDPEAYVKDHVILAPGNGLKCHCGENANRFTFCAKCKRIVASCGGHKKTTAQEQQDHCK